MQPFYQIPFKVSKKKYKSTIQHLHSQSEKNNKSKFNSKKVKKN